jgi:hypothetical protein
MKEVFMKKILIGLFLFGSFSSYAHGITCSGKSLFKNYHVYLTSVSSDLSSARLTIWEFKMGEHHGDYILGAEFISTKLPSSQENILDIFSTIDPSSIAGKIDLATGKGNLKIRGFGIKRNIKLSKCRLI